MGRSGDNINQLAKHANALKLKGALPAHIVSHFNRLMEDHMLYSDHWRLSQNYSADGKNKLSCDLP